MSPYELGTEMMLAVKREHDRFPYTRLRLLCMTRPGFWQLVCAIRLIPALVAIARGALTERWRSALWSLPGQETRVLVYDLCDGKAKVAHLDGNRWFDDNGNECCRCQKEVLWRYFQGPNSEPWHDQIHDGVATQPGSKE